MSARTVGVDSDFFLLVLSLVQEVDPTVLPQVIEKFKLARNTDFPENGRKEFLHELALGGATLRKMEMVIARGKLRPQYVPPPSPFFWPPRPVPLVESSVGEAAQQIVNQVMRETVTTLAEALQQREEEERPCTPPPELVRTMEQFRDSVDGEQGQVPYPPHRVVTIAGVKYGLLMTCRLNHQERPADQLFLVVDERDLSRHPHVVRNEEGQVLVRSNRHSGLGEEPTCAVWVRAYPLHKVKRIRFWYVYEEDGRRKEKKFYFQVKDSTEILEVSREKYAQLPTI